MQLYDSQKKSVKFALINPYSIIALPVGRGKSIVALTVGVKTKSKILIVCPAYLRFNWQNEINKWYSQLKGEIFESKSQNKFNENFDYAIISYDSVKHFENLFEWCDLLICDEAHNLKSIKAKRTDLIHKFVYENSIKRLMLLTGTPIQNRVHEFYSLICLCNYNPKIESSEFLKKFESYVDFADHFSFRKEFEMMINNRRIKVINWEGFQKVDELKTYLKGIYLRIKDETDMPSKVHKDVLISNSENKELLLEFQQSQAAEGMDKIRPKIKAMSALSKTEFTIQYVKDLLENGVEKVIIYSDHVDSAHRIAQAFDVKAITGSMLMNERNNIANAFQTGNLSVLIATIGSFSTGITLTSCHNTVFNDLPWTPSAVEQAEGRTWRIGQKHVCYYHFILGSFSDQHIKSKILMKNEIIKNVT